MQEPPEPWRALLDAPLPTRPVAVLAVTRGPVAAKAWGLDLLRETTL